MPGITIKNELSLFKIKLKNLADKIEKKLSKYRNEECALGNP